jgi:DNA polymerase III epsilon subunit-like protein
MTILEIRATLRRQGRILSEEMITRACGANPRLRAISGGRFALLSQLLEESEDVAPDEEPLQQDHGTLSNLSLLREGSYVIVDLETTGLDPDADSIIQIGAVRVRHGEIDDVLFEPINPGDRSLPQILRRTLNIPEGGQMDRLICEAPSSTQVVPRFLAFLGSDLLVAHNGKGLDFPFLVRQGLSTSHPILDSLELAFLSCPESPTFNLQALAVLAGLDTKTSEIDSILSSDPRLNGVGAHNALFDAVTLHLVIRYLVERVNTALDHATPYGRTMRALLCDLFAVAPESDATLLDVLREALSPKGFPAPRYSGAEPRLVAPIGPEEVERNFSDFLTKSGRDMRSSQLEMGRLVAETLKDGGTRLIEAPTGTGKS